MTHNSPFMSISRSVLLLCCLLLASHPTSASASTPRKLALVKPQPLILKYHNGPTLRGNLTVNLIWYGNFSPIQRSIIVDFIQSLSAPAPSHSQPSVSSWWRITSRYRGIPCTLALGKQILDEKYSFGKVLKPSQLVALSSRLPHKNSVNVVLTSADVAPERFCMSACGAHASGLAGKHNKTRFVFAWVGNPEKQCPGQCAWPFHKPIEGQF